jgi:hypothetical protein
MFCAKNRPVFVATTDFGSRWSSIACTRVIGPSGAGSDDGDDGDDDADDGDDKPVDGLDDAAPALVGGLLSDTVEEMLRVGVGADGWAGAAVQLTANAAGRRRAAHRWSRGTALSCHAGSGWGR